MLGVAAERFLRGLAALGRQLALQFVNLGFERHDPADTSQGQAFVGHLGNVGHLEHVTLAVATLPTRRAGWLHDSFNVKAANERSTNAEHVGDLAYRKHRSQLVAER